MNKKKFAVLALLMIALVVLTSAMFVACNNDNNNSSDDTQETIEATKDILISNGDFKVVDTSAKDYPRSVTSWTGGKSYSSGKYNDDVTAGAISLDKSKYDANKSKWNDSDDSLYNALVAGGRYGDDDKIKNALMIYMPEKSEKDGKSVNGPTAYGYTSASFTIAKGGYYKLSVDVLTKDIKGDGKVTSTPGARIYLSSNTYAEFDAIDTKGEWKTFEIIIEGSPSSASTLSVMLGLGKYSASYTTGLTTGYAVFDNLTLTKLESNEDKDFGAKTFQTAVDKEKANDQFTKTASLKVSNGRFDFGTTSISSSGTPNGWSLVTGNSGSNDSAPSSLGYNGIIDVTAFAENYSKYSTTYYTKSVGTPDKKETYVPAESLKDLGNEELENSIVNLPDGTIGKNVFMLSQQLMTAQGIKSSRSITVEKNKTYALSVNLYTYGVHGAGASLILSGNDGKDIVIKGISYNISDKVLIGGKAIDSNSFSDEAIDQGVTTNGWKTYTFYIKGNQFKDFSYNMTIWLGTEGTSSNNSVQYKNWGSDKTQTTYRANGTFANGWLFIDELNLKEISSENIPSALTQNDGTQTLDLTKAEKSNYQGLVVNLESTNMSPFDGMLSNTSGNPSQDGIALIDGSNGIPQGWSSDYDLTNPKNPIAKGLVSEGVVELTQNELPYNTENKYAYQIKAIGDSRYEIQTQTFKIEKNKFYRISVWVKTIDVKETSGAYVYLIKKGEDAKDDSTLVTFSQINTNSEENGFDPYLNDWCELTMFVKGSEKEDTNVSLKFALGSGDRWASDTLASGSMFVANVNGAVISQSVYDAASTGTYVKSASLASSASSYTFTNGAFDEFDSKDENLEEGKTLDEQKHAAAPTSWTFSDKTLKPNTDDSKLVAGVIALNTSDNKSFSHSAQSSNVFPNVPASVFDNLYGGFYDENTDHGSYPGNKAQLLAIGANDGTSKFAAGFTSNSKTLSANSYYALSVYANTIGNTTFSISLSGEASVDSSSDSNTFVVTNENAAGRAHGWTKYTFYIRTGQSSVSVKLNLWLGQDATYGTTSTLTEDSAKSGGIVLFDNVTFNTIDKEKYDSAQANKDNKTNNKISFLTDSFDSLSSTIESRKSLSTPNGWSGSVSGTESSKSTLSGILFAGNGSTNYEYETEFVGDAETGELYARVLGADYTVDSDEATPTAEEIAAAKENPDYADVKDDEAALVARLKENKVIELKKANWIPVSKLTPNSGNQMLVINNTVKSAYTYTSSSFTLKEGSFYEVSVYVKTYGTSSDDDISGANIELYLGSANESDKPFSFTAIKQDEWTKYTFFVRTMDDDVTSVTVKLSLGTYESETVDGETTVTGITSGYAMFDDVTVREVEESDYEQAVTDSKADKKILTRQVSNETKGSGDDDNDGDDEKPDSTFNTEALWWMVPTIVLAVLIIVVLIVYIVRKVRKPISKKKEKKAASPVETPSLDAKHNKYDENKE